MKATQIFYEGRVQGVGFRWTIKDIALGFEVRGTVRNLPDNRVELQVAGDEDEVKDFLAAIRDSSLAGHITNEHTHTIETPKPFQGFQIIA